MWSSKNIAVSVLMTQAYGFDYLPAHYGDTCKVDYMGTMQSGSCGDGERGATSLQCLDSDGNVFGSATLRNEKDKLKMRKGRCGDKNNPNLGAPCFGGMMGSCGGGERDSSNLSCDQKNNPGTAAKNKKHGLCMQQPINYFGQKCHGNPGECGRGLAPQYQTDQKFECVIKSGDEHGFCTIKCDQGTQNPCPGSNGWTCQTPPGQMDTGRVGAPGVCMHRHAHQPHIPVVVVPKHMGESCQRWSTGQSMMGICGEGERSSENVNYVCHHGYCSTHCTMGVENNCTSGYTCGRDGPNANSSNNMGKKGVCLMDNAEGAMLGSDVDSNDDSGEM